MPPPPTARLRLDRPSRFTPRPALSGLCLTLVLSRKGRFAPCPCCFRASVRLAIRGSGVHRQRGREHKATSHGAAARTCQPGDQIIICSSTYVDDGQITSLRPKVLTLDEANNLRESMSYSVRIGADKNTLTRFSKSPTPRCPFRCWTQVLEMQDGGYRCPAFAGR
ncbi:aspartate 1-decarboxylase [Sinorhizobium meliloti]|uniref:aspartate 1-decarboxylase n=1 Tax=Rhizobium meliloti TaxID=382 RepID=UPI000FDB7667|nr:aspartate 1-decarboxylase [Sinorhizobium meliloti]RVH51414.1 hypothetical protein CN212_08390 [Sinorhizobium meliloti]